MRNRTWLRVFLSIFILLLCCDSAFSQRRKFVAHEIAPFLGAYAPDRFETSLAFGVRYFYNIDRRFGVGAMFGVAHARQNFLRKVSALAVQPGSDRVIYHGARATQTFPAGRVEPYLTFHLGLTRLYDQSSFTFGFGVGTKIYARPKFSIRYEIMNYIFSSGRDLNAWTNKNLEMAVAFGYYL